MDVLIDVHHQHEIPLSGDGLRPDVNLVKAVGGKLWTEPRRGRRHDVDAKVGSDAESLRRTGVPRSPSPTPTSSGEGRGIAAHRGVKILLESVRSPFAVAGFIEGRRPTVQKL